MPFAAINGAKIYYQQHGSGDDVVFIHGAGGNHLAWWQQVPAFAERYRVTVFDARGWGLSRGDMGVGRWTLGSDLVALLDHLGIEKAHLVAQSMGGRSVSGVLRLAPERIRSIVLCGTTSGASNDRVREMQEELRQIRAGRNLNIFSLAPGYEEANPELGVLFRQVNAINPKRPAGLLGKPPPNYRGSMHGLFVASGVPLLWIVGEHDLITSPALIRECAGLVPGSQVYEVLGAGHSCYFEKPAEWNRVVLTFLEDQESLDGRAQG